VVASYQAGMSFMPALQNDRKKQFIFSQSLSEENLAGLK